MKRTCLGVVLSLLLPISALAFMPSHPGNDANFLRLPDGTLLSDIKVSGTRLSLQKGRGGSFGSVQQAAYLKLKNDSQTQKDHKVQWALMDLDDNLVIAQSVDAQRKVFGASTSKVFVGGSLLDFNQGRFNGNQKQLAAEMIVVSSNTAWTNLQTQLGGGNSNTGRQRNLDFTQKMGYERTRGFQGNLGSLHGNELTALETVRFMHDTYKGNYPGAEYLWKLMYTSRTGNVRGKKYLPSSVYVGGKTGTYDGATTNPETGSTKNPDGTPYKVKIRNHLIVFNAKGKQYALAVLANSGLDDSSALLAGGLYREFIAP